MKFKFNLNSAMQKAKETVGLKPKHGLEPIVLNKPEKMSDEEFQKYQDRYNDFYKDKRMWNETSTNFLFMEEQLLGKLSEFGIFTTGKREGN